MSGCEPQRGRHVPRPERVVVAAGQNAAWHRAPGQPGQASTQVLGLRLERIIAAAGDPGSNVAERRRTGQHVVAAEVRLAVEGRAIGGPRVRVAGEDGRIACGSDDPFEPETEDLRARLTGLTGR